VRARLRASRAALLPLLAAYTGLAVLYGWQALERATPTLFSDEIEFTQVSRSIASSGRATIRGANPATNVSLYEYIAAPFWWIDDVGTAYGAIKLLGVLLMTAAIFPAYALARLVVSRPYALFAALGAVVAPALSYSPFLVEEPLAYPVATLALFLIARAGVRPARVSIGLAVGVCASAILVRTQLAVLFPVLAIVLLAAAWRTDPVRRWRETWTTWDRIGAVVLLIGGAVVLAAVLGRHSYSWYVATTSFKERMLEYGLWAFGGLAIGVGVVPFIATLIALVRPRPERDARTTTFVALTGSSVAAFGLYTAVKVAYLSTNLSVVIAERNLIYLTPLLFVGSALVLERRTVSWLAAAAATAVALYLVTTTPLKLETYPNYETHGLAIAAFANRIPKWPTETIETALVLVVLGSALSLIALRLARSRATRVAVASSVALFSLTWSLTTEVYAANGERGASDQQYATLPKPPNWVDRTTGGASSVFVGQGVSDPNPFWQLEFWNPSIKWFWGIDGSTPGGVTPNLLRPDGTQDPADLGAGFAVASKGVALAAPSVTTVGDYVVYRLSGSPVRLRQASTGIAADGWMSSEASYTLYDVMSRGRGYVKVTLSRQGACFPQLEPADAVVAVGPVGVNEFDQPGIARVTAQREVKVKACEPNPVVLPVPRQPWRVEISLDPTFVPRELDPNQGDARKLGAVVGFEPFVG